MAKKPLMFVVSQFWYFHPFERLFKMTHSPIKADVILFSGGADVSPELYGEPEHPRTYTSPKRDVYERQMFYQALARGKKMIGICRGAQLLTVLNGGKLVQHVENHGTEHEMITHRGDRLMTSSTHHQMMNPYQLPKENYRLLAWADGISTTFQNGYNREIPELWANPEPEVIWYPRTQALCIQGHPEMMPSKAPGLAQYQEWAREFLY